MAANNHIIHLKMFDVLATIESDSMSLMRFIHRMYKRFLIGEFSHQENVIEFAFYTQSKNRWGMPVLVLAGDVWPLDEGGILESFAYDGILNTILSRVRSHFLIHAGTIAKNGRGVLLVAEAGHGKTTLSIELVRRGFNFLSDELAGLNRTDSSLTAFPRSLRVRPDTISLLGLQNMISDPPLDFGKYLLDIEELFRGSLVESASTKYIFLLGYNPYSDTNVAEIADNEFGLYLDRIDEELMNGIRSLTDVRQARWTVEIGFPVVRVQADNKLQTIAKIEQICQERKIHILETSMRIPVTPSFSNLPVLEEISISQAVQGLLRQFQPGSKSALLAKDFAGSPTRFFIALAHMLQQAECYRLTVGPLNEMASLIESVVV